MSGFTWDNLWANGFNAATAAERKASEQAELDRVGALVTSALEASPLRRQPPPVSTNAAIVATAPPHAVIAYSRADRWRPLETSTFWDISTGFVGHGLRDDLDMLPRYRPRDWPPDCVLLLDRGEVVVELGYGPDTGKRIDGDDGGVLIMISPGTRRSRIIRVATGEVEWQREGEQPDDEAHFLPTTWRGSSGPKPEQVSQQVARAVNAYAQADASLTAQLLGRARRGVP